MTEIASAWAFGQWEVDDPIANVWRRIAKEHFIAVESTRFISRAVPRLDAQSLVLIKSGPGLAPTLAAAINSPARVIVYIPEGADDVAPARAVELCQGNVLSVMKWRTGLPDSFANRLDQLYTGKHMYRELRLPKVDEQDGSPPRGYFVAYPYLREGRDFRKAAEAALGARGLEVINPMEFIESGLVVSEKVTRMLRSADFVIADTEENNRNVWFEVGFAMGQEKPTILCTLGNIHDVTRGRVVGVASILEGVEPLNYWDILDLTMKLYWGFRWVTPNGRP